MKAISLRFALPVLALLALTSVLLSTPQRTPQDVTPPSDPAVMIGKKVPDFDLPGLYGSQPGFKTSDLKGHVTLVNIFASWCLPCRAEHPQIKALADSGTVVVGIAYKDKAKDAQRFLEELGNPYRIVAYDIAGRSGIAFGISGVPETYLIDKEGIIRFRHAGPLTEAVITKDILPLTQKLASATARPSATDPSATTDR